MFQHVSPLPPDPLLGISIAYAADPNPKKVDLGVGVYKDETGQTSIFRSVKAAEGRLITDQASKAYVGSAGSAVYNELMTALIFGVEHPVIKDKRVATIQTTGGCAALRVAAEFIHRCQANSTVWLSDPTWANHQPLLGDAGLALRTYPYYDQVNNEIRFADMMAALENASSSDVVLLHGCCHNPSGADLTKEHWQALTALALRKGFLVFIDLAYQGFGDGLDEDAYGVRLMAESLPELIIASSCSKNFSIYRERTGTLCVVTEAPSSAPAVQTHLNKIVRGIYSMPPGHGASIVETLLLDPALRDDWEVELSSVRTRIKSLRRALADALAIRTGDDHFRFIEAQMGMFSFLGLNENQVTQLKDNHSIYIAGSSRMNVAGLNLDKIDYVADAIVEVIR